MWYQVSQPTHGRRLPKWALRAYQHEGKLFVPAALGASEQEVMLCASYDGVSVCLDAGHVYVEAEWLAKNYPWDGKPHCSVLDADQGPRVQPQEG